MHGIVIGETKVHLSLVSGNAQVSPEFGLSESFVGGPWKVADSGWKMHAMPIPHLNAGAGQDGLKEADAAK